MSLGPILPGRLPAPLIARRLSGNLQAGNSLLQRLQDQLATGQRFFLPSEEPGAAVRTVVLQRSIERKTQFQTNVTADRSFLAASESALGSVSEALNRAKSLLIAGVGQTATNAERQAMANEIASLLQSVVNAGNLNVGGRYAFAGSQSNSAPFEFSANGTVVYRGDAASIQSFADADLLVANNADGRTAFAAVTEPISRDVNPALTLDTRLADVHRGLGVQPAAIRVTLDDGVTTQSQSVDLTGAETVRDLKTRIEAAFAAGPLTVTVDIDPSTNHGLRLTPSAGTVAVTDLAGQTVAAELGIAGGPAAVINGGNLDPRLTELTALAALNGGAGIGATAGTGLVVTVGSVTKTIDISAAQTVEDLFNLLRAANLSLDVGINDSGDGLAISSRVNGAAFSIGENGGQNATRLGIRTLDIDTRLEDLNLGRGVPVNAVDAAGALLPAEIEITRRNGATTAIDLAGAVTVQDVLDRINAADPGVLVASLNATGNGISLTDNDGVSTGTLAVADGPVAQALGIAGEETSGNPATPLVGKDVHPQRTTGVFGILADLEAALRAGDDLELARLDPLFDREIERVNGVRGEIGGRLALLDRIESRILDEKIALEESLSLEFDTDISSVVTQMAQVQTTLQAVLAIAARTQELSLTSFL